MRKSLSRRSLDVEGLEQVLLLGRREVEDIGGESESGAASYLVYGVGKLFRQRRQQRDRLARPLFQLMHAGGGLGRIDLGLADLVDQGDKERVTRHESGGCGSGECRARRGMAAVCVVTSRRISATVPTRWRCSGPGVSMRASSEQHADRLVGARSSLRAGNGLRAAERQAAPRRRGAARRCGSAG